ncbi:MAG TPA: GDSL-type esterase/lipase family protein [Lentimicrobium sp.]|nr:GDSL-type esterase/lipase family protein [Lentimicrobium sp.]
MRKTLILFLFFTAGINASAQRYILDSILLVHVQIIHKEHNTFAYADSSDSFRTFFGKLDSLYEGHRKNIQIFHIGGSHIQADFYSNKVREYLRNITPYTHSSRGLIFPYRLAGTNNPLNYNITGNSALWKGYRSSLSRDTASWGLCGIAATLLGKEDTIRIKANRNVQVKSPYTFNKIRLFAVSDSPGYSITPADTSMVFAGISFNTAEGYCEISFPDTVKEAGLVIRKNDTSAHARFSITGLELLNDFPGVIYHSVGVNGASFKSYNRCNLFYEQLKMYKPDLFIVSIGTNDAGEKDFDPEKYGNYYDSLIRTIKSANPECAILLTVPNDSYYRKKHPNRNTGLQQTVIHELARKHGQAVWDFYAIMGGLGSSQQWYNRKLMVHDRVHFTTAGYSVKGDLLITALIAQWEKTTGREPGSLLNRIKDIHE